GAGAYGGDEGDRRQQRILHAIGVLSPPSYWEVAAEYLEGSETKLRAEAAVALEQLAASEALRDLQSALHKEKDKDVLKEILRALGTCGANDKGVRTLLLKKAGGEKDELLRTSAIAACGFLSSGDDVAEVMTGLVQKGTQAERMAAACAMG